MVTSECQNFISNHLIRQQYSQASAISNEVIWYRLPEEVRSVLSGEKV